MAQAERYKKMHEQYEAAKQARKIADRSTGNEVQRLQN
jgi:hypothetical protein